MRSVLFFVFLAILAIGIATIPVRVHAGFGHGNENSPYQRVSLKSSMEAVHAEGILNGNDGVDRPGSDLPNMPISLAAGASPKDCAFLCLNNTLCKAWVYGKDQCTGEPSPVCYLKAEKPALALNKCMVSGVPNAHLGAQAFTRLPLGAVSPAGWMADEVNLQATGLAGHLQYFWADVQDSIWIGGTADGENVNQERMPYWMNGMVPTAHLAQDKDLINYTRWVVDYLLKNQSEDGFLGPRDNFNPWPRMLILYTFQQYYEVNSTDTRILPAIYKYLEFLTNQYLSGYNPETDMWTYVRIQDFYPQIYWLYDNYPQGREQFLLDLIEIFGGSAGFDWKSYYRGSSFPKGDVGKGNWGYYSHGVNNGMALKGAALYYRFSQDQDDINSTYQRFDIVDQYHGLASGIFSCDECFAGNNPSRGSETCTVVEAMFSYASIYSVIGDGFFADRTEMLMFNALPATLTPDIWEHQYLQQSNEINSEVQSDYWWNTDGGYSNVYGLAPNYGCCTVNYPQGIGKYVPGQYLSFENENGIGIIHALLGPSNLAIVLEDAVNGDNPVTVNCDTIYPFGIDPTLTYSISALYSFQFAIRIPAWVVSATIVLPDGSQQTAQNGTVFYYTYKPSDNNKDNMATLTVTFKSTFRVAHRYNDAVSIYYGPLLMALNFSYNHTVLQQYAFNSQDISYLPTGTWNIGIQIDENDLGSSLTIEQFDVPKMPFDPANPPLVVYAFGREIDWPIAHDSADVPPQSPVKSSNPLIPITLIPFGSSMLRIAEIPYLTSSSQHHDRVEVM